jgi:hypothetical protein
MWQQLFSRRYYSMDCNALHANSKKGQYWAYASQQLVHNQAMGMFFTKIGLRSQTSVCNMSQLPSLELSKLTRVAESVKSEQIFKVWFFIQHFILALKYYSV